MKTKKCQKKSPQEKFNLQERKEIAHADCMILWNKMAETGCTSKTVIIKTLKKAGKLVGGYGGSCPFCFYLRRSFEEPDESFESCRDCLWGAPERKSVDWDFSSPCMLPESPFTEWMDQVERVRDAFFEEMGYYPETLFTKELIPYARKVFEYIEVLEH